MLSWKWLKLKWIHESLPTALKLNIYFSIFPKKRLLRILMKIIYQFNYYVLCGEKDWAARCWSTAACRGSLTNRVFLRLSIGADICSVCSIVRFLHFICSCCCWAYSSCCCKSWKIKIYFFNNKKNEFSFIFVHLRMNIQF